MPIARRRAGPIVRQPRRYWLRRRRQARRRRSAGRADVPALTRAYNALRPGAVPGLRRRPRQYRVLALFDRHRHGDGAGRRARRDRARDGRRAPAQPRARRRSTTPMRRRSRSSTATTRATCRRPARRACGSPASAARRSPRRSGDCPFPASRDGDICVATPALSAVGQAPGRQCADDRRRCMSPRTMRRCSRTATPRKCSSGASLDTVNGWVSKRTEGKIEKILEKLSDVILVNAVYFKSRWALAFDKKLTRQEFFSLTRSRQEMVPTMLQRTQPCGGVARGLSRDPAALCGALAGDGDRAAERGGRAWRRRAPARPRRARADAGRAPQGAAAAGHSHAAALQGGICGRSQGRVPEAWHDASVRCEPLRLLRSDRPAAASRRRPTSTRSSTAR